MPVAKLKCKFCKEYFKRETMVKAPRGRFCTNEHKINWAIENQATGRKKIKQAQNKEHTDRKRQFRENDRPFRLRATQKSFNAYIRKRDEKEGCSSCSRSISEIEGNDGWKVGGAWDCGHYLTVGAHPELRFEELNAHKQCKSCNGGSGKYTKKNHTVGKEYRIRLIKKIGLDKVEWLEGPHKAKKYTCTDLMVIERYYKDKLKRL